MQDRQLEWSLFVDVGSAGRREAQSTPEVRGVVDLVF